MKPRYRKIWYLIMLFTLSWVVHWCVGDSEGLSLLLWRVGGFIVLSVDLEVFAGVSDGSSLYVCVIGGDGFVCGDFEIFAAVAEGSSLIFWVVERSVSLSGDPIRLVGVIKDPLETYFSVLKQLWHRRTPIRLLMMWYTLQWPKNRYDLCIWAEYKCYLHVFVCPCYNRC